MSSEFDKRDLTSCLLQPKYRPRVRDTPAFWVVTARQERSDDTDECGPAACLIPKKCCAARGRANKVSDQDLKLACTARKGDLNISVIPHYLLMLNPSASALLLVRI